MTRSEAEAYASQWASDWNRLELEAVFAHFEEGIVWSSPKATEAVGVPTVYGKAALRDYLVRVDRGEVHYGVVPQVART